MSAATLAIEPRGTARAGLGDLARRLREEDCSIAYLGASVTVQKEGYRPRLHELIRRRFGREHTSVMSAVGAISIRSAAFLSDELVVAHRPDLCIIEYATQGSGRRDVEEAGAALDGIIAKVLAVGCQPVLLHLYRRGEDQEQMVANYEEVAERHQAPTIDLLTPIREAVSEGQIEKRRIFSDGTHTTPEGAQLVASMADIALGRIVDAGGPGPNAAAVPSTPSYRDAHAIPASLEEVQGRGETGVFRLQRPYVTIGEGSKIVRRFEGDLHGLALVSGPESGEVEVAAPGLTQRKMAFDEASHYERFTTLLLRRPVPAGREVTIELTDTKPDYSICKRLLEPPPERSLKLFSYLVSS